MFLIHGDGTGDSGGGISFLAADRARMKENMPGVVLKVLEELTPNVALFFPTAEEIVDRAPGVLSAITGVPRTNEETKGLLNGDYCMTNDNLLKMVASFVRVRCGISVVLMGECGCGKSELMKFLCAFLRVRLLTLNVHGGHHGRRRGCYI